MTLLVAPLRLALQIFSFCVVVASIMVLAFAAFAVRNYLRSPSSLALENLARGTVAVRSATGEGTGALIREGNEWEVVTAAHVVGNSKSAEITSRSGDHQTVGVTSLDRDRDVAILSVRPERSWVALSVTRSLPFPSEKVLTRCFFDESVRQGPFVGPVDDLRQGQEHVVSIDLSAIVDPVRALSPRTGLSVVAFFGVDPGCSGAPLVDREGRLIGLVLAGNSQTAVAASAAAWLP
jgi:S1-C subfamily serine protease